MNIMLREWVEERTPRFRIGWHRCEGIGAAERSLAFSTTLSSSDLLLDRR
jgi:hypothetical protein